MADLLGLVAYAYAELEAAGQAAQSTYVGKALEVMAVRRLLGQAHLRYPDNDLVARLAQEMLQRRDAPPRLPEGFSLEAALRHTRDSADVRRFLYELAECRIAAAGSGLFGTGERVTQREAAFLAALRIRLGLDAAD